MCEKQSKVQLAVWLRNITFSYGRFTQEVRVINNLSMNVPVNSVYSLLGPSGCGKTTLIGIICGLIKSTNGVVRLFGYPPGSVESGIPGSSLGYMPQETSLYSELTVYETLFYFGRIFGLPFDLVKQRISELVELLEIPCSSTIVSKLSGGQKRRVSFAVAVIHQPRLVILDEPTCGLDPVLCDKIWTLLNKYTKECGMTIIMTTHYIEESRKAGTIGFMRKGKLLEEDATENIFERYRCKSIESIFHRICTDRFNENTGEKQELSCCEKISQLHDSQLTNSKVNSYVTTIFTLLYRYVIQDIRQPVFILFIFILPYITLNLINICASRLPSNIPIGWVNDDQLAFNEFLNTNHSYPNDWSSSYERLNYSEALYNAIDSKMLNLIVYNDLHEALIDAEKLNLKGIIHLRKFFSDNWHKRYVTNALEEVTETELETSRIWLYGDLTNLFILKPIQLTIEQALLKVLQQTEMVHLSSYNHTYSPFIRIEGSEVYTQVSLSQINLSQPMLLAFIAIFQFSLPLGISGLLQLNEIGQKTLDRIYAAGVSPYQLMIAQLILRFPLAAVMSVSNLIISIYLFQLPCKNSIYLPFSILLFQSLCGCSMGMFAASFFSSLHGGAVIIVSFSFVFFFISGLLWPIEAVPYFIKILSYLSPITYSTVAFKTVMLKESVSSTFVIKNIALTIALMISCIFATSKVLLYRKNSP